MASYTEICGRQIFFNGANSTNDSKCYNKFIEYMGAGQILTKKLLFEGKKVPFKDAVRNGLVHRYFMKVASGAVEMHSSNPDALKTGFVVKEPGEIVMVVIPYFSLFCSALKKARDGGLLKWQS